MAPIQTLVHLLRASARGGWQCSAQILPRCRTVDAAFANARNRVASPHTLGQKELDAR